MKRLLFTLTACYWAAISTTAQSLVINELMQSNIDCIMDDLNDFPDSWVELYNAGTTAVSLKQFKIGVTDNPAEAWQLPDKQVAANGYVLVCCDKEGTNLHTDFRLESGKGCCVYLFQNNNIVDKVTDLKKQPAPNIAYGRKTDGGTEMGYQQTPTPNATNCGTLCTKVLGEPVFSQKGRVVTNSNMTSLILSLPDDTPDGAVIKYTLDGTEPTMNSTTYKSPLSFNSDKIVRAKLFCDGYLSPRSTAHSYLFFPRQLTLPVISIMTDNKYLNDPKIGIYVDGSYQSGKKNYEFNWRRPINIEYFEGENQESIINQLCETRIMGGASRGHMMKSLAVYAHKRFGTKRLNYEFFPDQKPGMTDFKSILLRNAGNDFDYLYMRDAVIQRTVSSRVDLDWQAWYPAIIYINGTYKGMLNIRERSNEDYVYSNYDGLEDIDMIENWWELKEGTIDSFNEFKAFYTEHGHTLAEYAERMDWEEFINLMVMNLYYSNLDFPGNNLVLWRPQAEGGRWRFIAKDTDFGLGLYDSPYNYKTLQWLYNPNYDQNHNWGANSYDGTRLFRRLMEDQDFYREFIDRTCIYMGDFLNERGTRELWDPMYEMIKYEYPNHRKLINQWWPNYDQELTNARNWLSMRTNEFYSQVGSYYQLGTPITLTVNKGADLSLLTSVTFNGVPLSEKQFDGKFFSNRTITLSGQAIDGKVITGWKIKQTASNGSSQIRKVSCEELTMTMPSCSSLAINAVVDDDTSGIGELAQQWNWQQQNGQLMLSGISQGVKVALYDLRGMLIYTATADGGNLSLPIKDGKAYILKVGSETVKVVTPNL